MRKINEKEQKVYDDQVEGRNSVIESGKDINKIFIPKGEKHRIYKQNNSKSKRK